MHLYVYYDVPVAREAELAVVVRALQAALATSHRCRGRVMRRPETRDGRATWMEVYEDVDADFEAALATAVARELPSSWDLGPRHVERFVNLD